MLSIYLLGEQSMKKIEFSQQEKEVMVQKVKMYFQEEMDLNIGGFDAEFLIDFFSSEMGAYYYNRGLYDAQTLLSDKLAEISDSLLQLEMPAKLRK